MEKPVLSKIQSPLGEAIWIDGSFGEGGGQVLRSSSALALLLDQTIHVTKIRAGRDKPGLRPQHLTGLQFVCLLSGGKLLGDSVGSDTITFSPGRRMGGVHTVDTGTAGSITLLVQVSLPCLIFSPTPCEVTYKGGTNAIMAPQIDYLAKVFLPTAARMGIHFALDLVMRGFYPKGGGVVKLRTSPHGKLNPLLLERRGKLKSIEIIAYCAGKIPETVPQRMVKSALGVLEKEVPDLKGLEVRFSVVKEPRQKACGDGTGIILVAETETGCLLAGSALGEKGQSSESVGEAAAQELVRNLNHGGCVDEHLQDQLILFMALAEGGSRLRTGPLTLHTTTNIHFCQMLTGAEFQVTPLSDAEGEGSLIICKGVGYSRPSTEMK